MREFSQSDFLAALNRALPSQASGRLCIAFSGGLDSTVLLHLAVAAARTDERYSVVAAHVDHGLHPDSRRWAEECERSARRLGVDYFYQQVQVPANDDRGVEAAARDARYGALATLIEPGDTLLTAHHADDQLETVLLGLMRGSGVAGLAGMPDSQPFGAGWHVRPLLGFTREQLAQWASAQQLSWLSDPSNEQTRFDRNYLRREVLPLLHARWPAVATNVCRSATHLGEASVLLEQLAADDMARCALRDCLKMQELSLLESARRRNVLRYWLKSRGARMPSTRKLIALEHDVLQAQSDRLPCIGWDGFEVRRHRGLLYGHPARSAEVPIDTHWDCKETLTLHAGMGALRIGATQGGGIAPHWIRSGLTVRYRVGGETLQPADHAHNRKLKKLLQAARVLPWWRDRLPLLYLGEALVAVGDLWSAANFSVRAGEEGVRILWDGRPDIIAVSGESVLD